LKNTGERTLDPAVAGDALLPLLPPEVPDAVA